MDKWTSVVVFGESEKNSDLASAVSVDRGELLHIVSLLGESRPLLQSIIDDLVISGVVFMMVLVVVSNLFVLTSLDVP